MQQMETASSRDTIGGACDINGVKQVLDLGVEGGRGRLVAGGFLFAVSNDHAETVAESNGKVCEGACREVSRLSTVNADPAMA